MHLLLAVACCFAQLAFGQDLPTAPTSYGPPLEIAHLYYGQRPTGVTVSSTGRIFSNYPAGLDVTNVNDGHNGKFQVAEVTDRNSEAPYPNVRINSPPGGAINYTTTPPTSANYVDYLIGVQSVVIDSKDRLWILDTGRSMDPKSKTQTLSREGGPKLVGVNLKDDSVFKTITFPPTVAYPDSYLNDVRFDLRAGLSGINGTEGVAYITDSSSEGRNGVIVVDIGTGKSWRHLDNNPKVRAMEQVVPVIWGVPMYSISADKSKIGFFGTGADGIALSADGEELYFSVISGRYLYSIPTARLRDTGLTAEVMAQGSIVTRAEKGISDGLETDTNGFIYAGDAERESISLYNPRNGTVTPFVVDNRLNWIDTLSVSNGYLYFTNNQLQYSPRFWPGTNRMKKPYQLFKVKLPNGGTKISPGA